VAVLAAHAQGAVSGRRIAIVTHAFDRFEHTRYLAGLFAGIWREQGYEVVVTHGSREHVAADVAIAHVDRTRTPLAYRRLLRRYPRVVNARVLDISKRRNSALRIRRGDGYPGPVIVKTNRNYSGLRELMHARARGGIARAGVELRHRLPWWAQSALPLAGYPIYGSAREVPRAVWWNPDLVVERFLPEPCAEGYRLRQWRFLGDRELHLAMIAATPLVKVKTALRVDALPEPVPEEIRAVRARLGFDFGKFDYGLVDGRAVLYDVNRTPSVPPVDGGFRAEAERLAGGIECFL
jgi:hypothetical protein